MPIIVDDRMKFGKRLKEVRIRKGLSTKTLANSIGLKSPGNVYLWEAGKQLPGEDTFKKLVKELSITSDYLLTGKQEETAVSKVIETPTKFDYKHTEEGYKDPTASAACDNAWFSGRTADVGDLADDKNGNLYLVIRKIDNNTAVLLDVQTTPITNHLNFMTLKQGEKSYYVNMNSFATKGRFLKDYRKKFRVSEVSFQAIKSKFNKLLGVDPILVNIVEESSKDEISEVFASSLNFYNEKNGTNYTCSKKVSLQEAYDISKNSGISLDDLCRDHEKEKAEEQIFKWMEEQEEFNKNINKKIDDLKAKFQIA